MEKRGRLGKGRFSVVERCVVKEVPRRLCRVRLWSGGDGALSSGSPHRPPGEDEDGRRGGEDEEVALKVISKSDILSDPGLTTQLCQERRIHEVCSHHQFVLPLLRVWQDDLHLFMAFPICDSASLRALWANRGAKGGPPDAFSDESVLMVCYQVGSALTYIHDVGIVHRDVKMENILVSSRSGQLQLTDFGLAKWLGKRQRTGTICGTLAYMAPEVLEANSYGHAVDWWSLGVCAYALAFQKMPFRRCLDNTHASMLEEVAASMPEVAASLALDPKGDGGPESVRVSDEVRRVLSSMLQLNDEFRPFSLKDLLGEDSEARFGPPRTFLDTLAS